MIALFNLIPLAQIRLDGGTQSRAAIDQEIVQTYADDVKAGVRLPPIIVFKDGDTYWLADGFHRYYAAKALGFDTIHAEVKTGDRRQAVLFSVGANTKHGLRRSNADKRRAVEMLLRDPEWGKSTDSWLAQQAHVSHTYIRQIRQELTPGTDISSLPATGGNVSNSTQPPVNTSVIDPTSPSRPVSERRIGRDGKKYRSVRPSPLSRSRTSKNSDLANIQDGLFVRLKQLFLQLSAAEKQEFLNWATRSEPIGD